MRAPTLLCLAVLMATSGSWAQNETKPDNTSVNKRDRQKNEPTADQQKENKPDRELARAIRSAIVKDKSLSTYAQNIKIVAENGTITLKGPVRSEEEKKAVETKAAEIAGKNVKSELSVAPDAKTQSQK